MICSTEGCTRQATVVLAISATYRPALCDYCADEQEGWLA